MLLEKDDYLGGYENVVMQVLDSSIFELFFLAILGFEFKALHLQGRCSTT
jgi:hypothetical protein